MAAQKNNDLQVPISFYSMNAKFGLRYNYTTTSSNKLNGIRLHSPNLCLFEKKNRQRHTCKNIDFLLVLDLAVHYFKSNIEYFRVALQLSQARKSTTVPRTTAPAHTTEPTKPYG